MSDPHADILLREFGFDTALTREACLERAGITAGGAEPESAVLDVGTGSGGMALVLARAGLRVVSLDVDASRLREARAQIRWENPDLGDRVTFLAGDGCFLPLVDASVSHVVSFDAMHHMPDCAAAVGEMFRVCRPGGTVALADLNDRGLAAVRSVVDRDGRRHEENPCRVREVGEIVSRRAGAPERHDLEFVTLFVARRVSYSPPGSK